MSIRFLRICSFLLVASAQTLPAAAETNPFAAPTLAPMVERVLPSVVSIAVTGTSQSDSTPLLADPFFRQFFDDFEGIGHLVHSHRIESDFVIANDFLRPFSG